MNLAAKKVLEMFTSISAKHQAGEAWVPILTQPKCLLNSFRQVIVSVLNSLVVNYSLYLKKMQLNTVVVMKKRVASHIPTLSSLEERWQSDIINK